MGRLRLRPAILQTPPAGAQCRLPHYHEATGTCTLSRTAIDRDTGAVDEHKLFHSQMVVPDCVFAGTLVLIDLVGEDCQLVADLLALWLSPDGLSLGRGTKTGFGRTRLDGDRLAGVCETRQTDGTLSSAAFALPTPRRRAGLPQRWSITLTCDGPYLSVGERRPPRRDDQGDTVTRDPHLTPLSRDDRRPEPPGPALIGAMRARAAWLDAVQRLQDDRPAKDTRHVDDRFRIFADVSNDPKRLTSTERLFGINGWAGLVRLDRLACQSCGAPADFTSVRLDRFDGGPIDNALYTVRAHVRPVFTGVVTLLSRNGAPTAGDVEAMNRLADDLSKHGLELGHGTGKGFGWFEVEMTLMETEAGPLVEVSDGT